jgi:acyl dehydratase
MSAPELGTAVPPLEQTITADLMMAYGAATWDWHRMHYDGDYARALGLPGPMLDGQAQGAFFARAVIDWLGPSAFIRRLSFQMRAMVFPGDTIRCGGVVREVSAEGGAALITLDQTINVGERLAGKAETEVLLRDPADG